MYYLLYELAFRDAAHLARENGRAAPIDPEWRGWRYDLDRFRVPLLGQRATMTEILGHAPSTPLDGPRVSGALIHSLYSKLLRKPRDILGGSSRRRELLGLNARLGLDRDTTIDQVVRDCEELKQAKKQSLVDDPWIAKQRRSLESIWDFETHLLSGLVTYELVAHPTHSAYSLLQKCVPFESEIDCDGSHLGLSENLRLDARTTHNLPMIIDLKTGKQSGANQIAIAGYALAWESVEQAPLDFGCVYYVDLSPASTLPSVVLDIFLISTALREAFIEKRNAAINRGPGAAAASP